MTMMWPSNVEGKGLDVSARLVEMLRICAGGDERQPAGAELKRGLWQHLCLRPGHDLQATASDRNAFNPPQFKVVGLNAR
jgi:hypothetical protein